MAMKTESMSKDSTTKTITGTKDATEQNIEAAVEEIFKAQGKQLLATLLKLFGSSHLQLAEDCLQETFTKALSHWRIHGLPGNPPAWLTMTAKHQAIDTLRKQSKTTDLKPTLGSEWTLQSAIHDTFENTQDDEITLLLWIATTELDELNQLAIMLKWLCGLSIEETANALFISYENAKKRLQRTRRQLSEVPFETSALQVRDTALSKVHKALYLLFSRTIDPQTVQNDSNKMLCLQSIGLVNLLLKRDKTATSETYALYALMHFHHARFPARLRGNVLDMPLDMQDRKKWGRSLIIDGTKLLDHALNKVDARPGRFLLEALITYEHCRATCFESTNWSLITDYYQKLYLLTDSPMYLISLAAAQGCAGVPEDGLKSLSDYQRKDTSSVNKHYYATAAFLHAHLGEHQNTTNCIKLAMKHGMNDIEQGFLHERINKIASQRP
ncbi:MAG: sigma-70 family RNA polymerase sigma factor [Pseudomonadota bacterium]